MPVYKLIDAKTSPDSKESNEAYLHLRLKNMNPAAGELGEAKVDIEFPNRENAVEILQSLIQDFNEGREE